MMSHGYDPSDYWGGLLQEKFDLRGVGYPWLSTAFNAYLYRGMADSVARELTLLGLSRENLAQLSILDVGSGTGFWIDFWKSRGARKIMGVDLTPKSVAHLVLEYPQFTFERWDICDPVDVKYRESFDLISVMSVLNHIPSAEKWAQALANLGRMVKPNGYIFIMDPILRHRWWGEPFDVESISRLRTVDEHSAALARDQVRVLRVVPTVAVLANPLDTKSKWEFRILELWWGIFCGVAARERLMRLTGWLFYGLDRLLCRLRYMPSSKILLCRKEVPAKRDTGRGVQ